MSVQEVKVGISICWFDQGIFDQGVTGFAYVSFFQTRIAVCLCDNERLAYSDVIEAALEAVFRVCGDYSVPA